LLPTLDVNVPTPRSRGIPAARGVAKRRPRSCDHPCEPRNNNANDSSTRYAAVPPKKQGRECEGVGGKPGSSLSALNRCLVNFVGIDPDVWDVRVRTYRLVTQPTTGPSGCKYLSIHRGKLIIVLGSQGKCHTLLIYKTTS
jgi:hypothetical protein